MTRTVSIATGKVSVRWREVNTLDAGVGFVHICGVKCPVNPTAPEERMETKPIIVVIGGAGGAPIA